MNVVQASSNVSQHNKKYPKAYYTGGTKKLNKFQIALNIVKQHEAV